MSLVLAQTGERWSKGIGSRMGIVSGYADEMREALGKGLARQVGSARAFFAFDLGWTQRSIHYHYRYSPAGIILKELAFFLSMKHRTDNYENEVDLFSIMFDSHQSPVNRILDEIFEYEDLLEDSVVEQHDVPIDPGDPFVFWDEPEEERAFLFLGPFLDKPGMYLRDWDISDVYFALVGYAANVSVPTNQNTMLRFLTEFAEWHRAETSSKSDTEWFRHYHELYNGDASAARSGLVHNIQEFLAQRGDFPPLPHLTSSE